MTIANAAILAARKACEEKTSLETIASEEATPSEKTVITPVTSDLKRTEDRGNNRDTRNLRREKEQSFPGSYSCYHFDCLHCRWHILVFAIR